MQLVSLLLASLFVAPPVPVEPDPEPEPEMSRDVSGDLLPLGAVGRYGTLRYRAGFVSGVAFSRDGKTVISSGAGNSLYFWETDTGKLIRRYEAFSSYNHTFARSPDGKEVVTGNWNEKELTLRDLETGKVIRKLPGLIHSSGVIRFSPDGKLVAACEYHAGSAAVWDKTTGKLVTRLLIDPVGRPRRQSVYTLAFSRDGKYIAVGGHDVRIFEVATWSHVSTLVGHTNNIETIAFTPDDSKVITSAGDRTVRVWDRGTEKEVRRISDDIVGHVALTRNGKTVIGSVMDGSLVAWDVATGKEIYRHSTKSYATRITLSDDETRIAGHFGEAVVVQEARTGKCLTPLLEVVTYPRMAAFSPNGRFLAIAYGGDDLRLWNVQSGRVSSQPKMGVRVPWAIRVNEAREVFVFASLPETGLEVWNLTAKKRTASLPNGGYFGNAHFASDGRVYAAQNELVEWNPSANRVEWRTPLTRKGASRSLLLSSNERVVLTWGDGEVKSWSAITRQELSNLTLLRSDYPLALSHDGKQFVTHGVSGTQLRDTRTGNVVHDFAVKQVRAVAFSPDGRSIVVGDDTGAFQLWDAKTLKRVRRIAGHRDIVTILLFSVDSRFLASVSHDTTILVWDVRNLAPGGK